jgi:hypothetical protein
MLKKMVILSILLLVGCGSTSAANTRSYKSDIPTRPPMTNVSVPWGIPYTTDLFTITMSRPVDVSKEYSWTVFTTTVTVTAKESLELSAIDEQFVGTDSNFGVVYLTDIGNGILPEGKTRVARKVQISIVEEPYDGRGFSLSCITQFRNETATWNYASTSLITEKDNPGAK